MKAGFIQGLLVSVAIGFSIGAYAQAVELKQKYRVAKGTIDPQSKDSLMSFLGLNAAEAADTLYIRYDYNGETCWDLLDGQPRDYIVGVINNSNQYLQQQREQRPGIRIFSYREWGNNFNKLKLWNSDIVIDEKGFLRTLLFGKKKATCGKSAIIFPSGDFLLFNGDSHFISLQTTSSDLHELLKK